MTKPVKERVNHWLAVNRHNQSCISFPLFSWCVCVCVRMGACTCQCESVCAVAHVCVCIRRCVSVRRRARMCVCVCVRERERERERARENRQLFVDSMARVQFHVHRRPGCAAVPILLSSHCRPPLTETSRVVRAHLGIVSLNMHAIHIAPVASSYHSTNTHAARSRSFSCLSEIGQPRRMRRYCCGFKVLPQHTGARQWLMHYCLLLHLVL